MTNGADTIDETLAATADVGGPRYDRDNSHAYEPPGGGSGGPNWFVSTAVTAIVSIALTVVGGWLLLGGRYVTREDVRQIIDDRTSGQTTTVTQMAADVRAIAEIVKKLEIAQAVMGRTLDDVRAQRK